MGSYRRGSDRGLKGEGGQVKLQWGAGILSAPMKDVVEGSTGGVGAAAGGGLIQEGF